MKSVVLLMATGLLASVSAFNLHSEFITGFESGIFMRDNEEIYEEYGCPRARGPSALANLNQLMGPLKIMSSLSKDKNVENMVATVELFVQSLSQLMAVFSGYDGGEFCSGLIFGSTGASMLTNIAQALATVSNLTDKSHRTPVETLAIETNSTYRGGKGSEANTLKDKFGKNNRKSNF